MIVGVPTLIAPLRVDGYLPTAEFFNYIDPNGHGKYISGLAEIVPAGSDIFPKLKSAAFSNCLTLESFTAPTFSSFKLLLGYDIPPNITTITDAKYYLTDGSSYNINPINGLVQSAWIGSTAYFRTDLVLVTATTMRMNITINSLRGGFIYCSRFEGGSGGITTVAFGGISVQPILSLRISDSTKQVLPSGSAIISAGQMNFFMDVNFTTNLGIHCEINLNLEVPYGL